MKYLLGYFVFLLLMGAAGGQTLPQKIYDRFVPRLVLVEYYEPLTSFESIRDDNRIKRTLSGLVVNDSGLVLTSSDLFRANMEFSSSTPELFGPDKAPEQIYVKLNEETKIPARFVGKDEDLKIAFIRLKEPSALKSVKFVSSPKLQIGERVFIVQNLAKSYGETPAVFSRSIIAKKDKPKTVYYCEGDIPSVRGFGLVMNKKGQPIGLYRNLRKPSIVIFGLNGGGGMGAIILFDQFKKLIANPPVFRQKQTLRKKWLGVYMQPFTRDFARYFGHPEIKGILIRGVIKNSPAAAAGLAPGDVITKINDKAVTAETQRDLDIFRQIIRNLGNDTIDVEIFRQNHFVLKKIRLGRSPISQFLADEVTNSELGFSVKELTKDIILAKNLDPETQGVWVSRVERAGWADVGGLLLGDLIKTVDDRPIDSLDDVRIAFKKISKNKPKYIKLFVERNGTTLFLFIKTNYAH